MRTTAGKRSVGVVGAVALALVAAAAAGPLRAGAVADPAAAASAAPTGAAASPAVASVESVAAVAAPVIRGVVRAHDTRRPLAGVDIRAVSVTDPHAYHATQTDRVGAYVLRGLKPGAQYQVYVEPDGGPYLPEYAPGTTVPERAGLYGAPAVVNVALTRGVPITGTLLRSNGRPAAEGSVSLVSVANAYDSRWAQVRAGGRWTGYVRPGRYLAWYSVDDETPWWGPATDDIDRADVVVVPAAAPGRPPVTLRERAPAPTRVAGRVVAAATGAAVEDACVSQHWDFATADLEPGSMVGVAWIFSMRLPCTDADGTYSMSVWPGPVRVTATPSDDEGRLAAATSEEVEVRRGTTTRVDIALPAGGALSGRLLDAATGRPVRGCVRAADPRTGESSLQAFGPSDGCAEDDGRWRIAGLPAGPVVLQVSSDNGHAEQFAPGVVALADARAFQVVPGRTTSTGVTRLVRTGSLTGRVLDAAGRPVVGAGVGVAGATWWEGEEPVATTDAAGRYRLTGVQPGVQRLRIVPPPRTGLGVQWVGRAGDATGATRIAVRPGVVRSVPDERLRPAATLKVRLTGRVDASFVVEAYDLQGRRVGRPGVVARDGVATVTGLPQGRVRVLAWSTRLRPFAEAWLGGERFSSATPVALQSGRTATVSLPVPEPVPGAAATRGTGTARAGATRFGGIGGARVLEAALQAGAPRAGADGAGSTGWSVRGGSRPGR